MLTWFLGVEKILAAFWDFFSNWLRLITLCENITFSLSCGPDCLVPRKFIFFLLNFHFINMFYYKLG